jgi:hypothetical protein
VLQQCFAPFETVGSLDGLLHSRMRSHIWRPVRARSGPQQGQLHWRRPCDLCRGLCLRPAPRHAPWGLSWPPPDADGSGSLWTQGPC